MKILNVLCRLGLDNFLIFRMGLIHVRSFFLWTHLISIPNYGRETNFGPVLRMRRKLWSKFYTTELGFLTQMLARVQMLQGIPTISQRRYYPLNLPHLNINYYSLSLA
jgi:hypothetical protein